MSAGKKVWQVEHGRDNFQEVRADRARIEPSGALIFHNGHPFEPVVVIAYSAQSWVTFFEDEDASA